MEKKIEYMQEAVNLANIAFEKKEIPIGAVVVLNDRIIGYGHNQREGSTKISGHAEIIAIESAARILNSWKLDECELYVTVEPCLMCCGAIIQSRIKKVYIGTKQRKFKKQSYRYYIENELIPFEIVDGVLANESQAVMTAFFKELREENND